MAQEWQSPWSSSPCPALSLPYRQPCHYPCLPVPQSRNCTRRSAPLDQPQSFYFPLPLAFPHKAGGIKAGTVALLLGQDCLFEPVGMGHRQPESCWVRGRALVPGWERFGLVAGRGQSLCRNLWAEIWPCHRDTSLVCSQDASLSLVNVF